MASGCSTNSPADKCVNPVSSNCVKMQNETNDILCQGDTLTEVIDALQEEINKIGQGNSLLSITFDCDYIASQMSGKTITLLNVIKVILTSLCDIKDDVEDVVAQVSTPIVYNTKCLQGNPTTTPQVVQALIDTLCSLSVTVTNINNQLNNQGSVTTTIQNTAGDIIKSAISSCNGGYGIEKTGTGKDVSISINALVPPCSSVFLWDASKLSFFDATGKGKSGTPFCGWYIMNGLNGTPNMMGYTAMGATNIPGIQGTLDTLVDPISNSDADYASSIGDKKGKVKHKLTSDENASHTHTINDPGHFHNMQESGALGLKGDSSPTSYVRVINGSTSTASATTNISINSSGTGKAHENRQPSLAGVWITRL